MPTIKRDSYLRQLIQTIDLPLVKIVTGLRRVGKSYLLNELFVGHLYERGITPDHIIQINLEDRDHKALLDPDGLLAHIKSRTIDDRDYFIILDEIQMVADFSSVLATLLLRPHLHIYATGSNSRFLSSDIATEFRGRSFNLPVYPLSFRELYPFAKVSKSELWRDYWHYGGLPLSVLSPFQEGKINYLRDQVQNIYLNDIIERYHLKNDYILSRLLEILASSVGLLNLTL